MLTERLRRMIDAVIDALTNPPPEEQDRVAAALQVALQVVLQRPPVAADAVRPAVMEAFERVMEHSTDVLASLRGT